MLDSQQNFSFDQFEETTDFDSSTSLTIAKPKQSTNSVIAALKARGEDFEWYPTTSKQIQVIVQDIQRIAKVYELESRNTYPSILDIGAGDGRVVTTLCDAINAEKKDNSSRDSEFKAYAIEKASVHINSYRDKNITLLGTDFYETNLISKNATFGFVNPPYSDFSSWVARIIETLRFKVLYAVIPQRWKEDKQIKQALANRGVKFAEVIAESDFLEADRKARAKVHLVRFSFLDLSVAGVKEVEEKAAERFKMDRRYYYQPNLSKNSTCPFQRFIEAELGLHKTHSETTEKFHEHCEKERIRKSLSDEESQSFEIVQSKGVLWALLDSYERDMESTLQQYKLIGQLDGKLLGELGVKHEDIVEGVKAKLYGFRNVYWSLLFDHLDVIKEKLTSEHKKTLLNTLSANALDFTYTNAVYIISYAVEMANTLIEESLVDVFKILTCEDSIKTYYKSNEHMFSDDWRYNRYHGNGDKPERLCKRELDYRFVFSSWGNFSHNSWDYGLNDNARQFTNDLLVVCRLLGYSNLHTTSSYEHMGYGDKLSIMGTHPTGKVIELVQIRYYKNGNRHMKWNQEVMLRFNVTVSRILGWVRSKEEFQAETDNKTKIKDDIWQISEEMKVLPSNVLALTSKV